MELVFEIILIACMLAASAFFSASETGIYSLSGAKLHKLKSDGNKRAHTLSKLREDKESLIGAILLGNNFVNTASSAIGAAIMIDMFGDSGWALTIATFVMTALILIFSEVMPKTYAVRHAEKVALAVAPACAFFIRLFKPITYSVNAIVGFLLKRVSKHNYDNLSFTALDEIRGAIEMHHEEGGVVTEDKFMLGGVIDLEDVTVEEVMIHRNDIKSVSIDQDIDEIVSFIISTPHSRIPVWKETPDNIIGVIMVKDLLKSLRQKGNSLATKDLNISFANLGSSQTLTT
jgi:Mg2+/Co2+ transporter CorB